MPDEHNERLVITIRILAGFLVWVISEVLVLALLE
jgi:hypothetical protein